MINYLLSVIISYIYIQNCQNVNEEEQLRAKHQITLTYEKGAGKKYLNDILNKVENSKVEEIYLNKDLVINNDNNITLVLNGPIVLDGQGNSITYDDLTDYKGLIIPQAWNGSIESAPIIKNLEIFSKESKLLDYSGYLIQSESRFFTLENCVNNINIKGIRNGGLCGNYAGYSGGNVSFTNCSNNGTIGGKLNGGLCGGYAGSYGGIVSFTNCSNNGTIGGEYNGGLCGSLAGHSGGNVSFTNCSNNGTIKGKRSGGLCGNRAGSSGGNVSFTNCSNNGTIGGYESGGLCGSSAGKDGGNVSFTNCSNNGTIEGRESGGLCGIRAGRSGGNVSFTNCSNYGVIGGNLNGGLAGSFGGNVSFTNCSNNGSINGTFNGTGGLCGSYASISGGNVSFTNCSNNGENKNPESNGQIVGSKTVSHINNMKDGFCAIIQTKGNNNQNITEYQAVELNLGKDDISTKSNPENIQLVFRK